MEQALGILLGGYAFILLSYVWVWAIGVGVAQGLSRRRGERVNRKDVAAVAGMLVVWTVACALLFIVDAWR